MADGTKYVSTPGAPGRPRVDGPDTLDRWPGERHDQHRAMLLLVMQDPDSNDRTPQGYLGGRNLGRVVACLTTSRSVVRRWSLRYRWAERMEHHGADAQAYAIELYRHLYYEKYARNDVPNVADVVSLSMSTRSRATEDREGATEVQREAVGVVQKLLPPEPPPEVQEAVESAADKRRAEILRTNERIAAVAKAGLVAVQQSTRAAVDAEFRAANPHITPVRARLTDLPKLRQVLADLTEERMRLEHPELAQAAGAVVVDSVRVRIAKESGGNVLDAVAEDCREVLAMVEGIRATAVEAATLAENDERERA